MHKGIQSVIRESLYGSPTLPQSAQSTFSPTPFGDSKPDPSYNFQIGTAEFGHSYTDEQFNDVMKNVEPILNELGIQYWSVNKTDKVLNISVTNGNINKAKEVLGKYGFHYNNSTFGGEKRTPDMNSTPKLTAYGREAGANASFGGGGLLSGYPVDRLAGE